MTNAKLTIVVPESLYAAATERAADKGCTLSDHVRALLLADLPARARRGIETTRRRGRPAKAERPAIDGDGG